MIKKIAFILGTRPEIIKLFSLIKECEKARLDYFIIHTNQHYDASMDANFFKELELPLPKYNLHVGSGTHGDQTGRMLIAVEKVLSYENPDVVLVQGDTNTVLAGALAASKLSIKVGHIEAGLRSYDRTMPEETNRIIADHISDFLFCPTEKQSAIAHNEGIDVDKIFVTGNTVVDAVVACLEMAETKSSVLKRFGLAKGDYFLLTCHRPSNTDSDSNFHQIIEAVSKIASDEKVACIFPLHPRLKNRKEYLEKFEEIIVCEPLGYLDLLLLQKYTKMVFTDSGGIQEEACTLQKKCLVLRTSTERPETIEVGGASYLHNITTANIYAGYSQLKTKKVEWYNPFGDGLASKKILDHLIERLR